MIIAMKLSNLGLAVMLVKTLYPASLSLVIGFVNSVLYSILAAFFSPFKAFFFLGRGKAVPLYFTCWSLLWCGPTQGPGYRVDCTHKYPHKGNYTAIMEPRGTATLRTGWLAWEKMNPTHTMAHLCPRSGHS